MNVFEELKARGLIAQCTNEEKLSELFAKEKVSFYIGFDATADSLHVGHFLQMVIIKHLLNAGHRPIVLLGTGTTLVGDPTGKTDMRKMLTVDDINYNADCFKKQMEKFIDFSDEGAMVVRNGDWLLEKKYLEFLREVGVHFTVNRMLAAECFKSRMEKGLSFIEFNYMIMQSYDFLHLFRELGCKVELGGDDQWSNILGGVDLVRRVCQEEVYGMTFTLLTTKDGKKMGKTENGAVWLDPEKTSPYEFFQYWRNVSDDEVINCLKLITFVSLDEIREMEKATGSELNAVKERLAYEVTKLVHGEENANAAVDSAKALFAGGDNTDNMPTTLISKNEFSEGYGILNLLVATSLAPSNGEARRLITQGGIAVNDVKISEPKHLVTLSDFSDKFIIIKKGKKVFHKVILED